MLGSWVTVGTVAAETATESTDSVQVARAIFAGGCFWCMEPPYDNLDGVLSTVSGYIGGHVKNPTYKQVSSGQSGHIEAVQISYDPDKISFEALLDVYWPNIDPTRDDGQFCDSGSQYRPALFYLDARQKMQIETSLIRVRENKPFADPIRVAVLPATEFYPAEDYHQDYYIKNPFRYKFYRYACGRDQRLQELWKSPS